MKTRILSLTLCVLLILSLFTGCSLFGQKIKNEAELQKDLLASDIHFVEGSEIAELTIIKRLTDEKEHSDEVYVSIEIDHEAATETRAYTMNYTLYNDGWLLDSTEPYYGTDAAWEISPKAMPTDDQILQLIIENSNSQIDAYYEEALAADPSLEQSYFFEEGKYQTSIYDPVYLNNPYDGIVYNCSAKTVRTFKYVDVEQTQSLSLYFNTYTYTWEFGGDMITDVSGTWHIDGVWSVPFTNAQVVFSNISSTAESDSYATCEGLCYNDIESIEFSDYLFYPTSQRITHSLIAVDSFFWDSTLQLGISVSPDIIWVQNTDYTSPGYGMGAELQPIDDTWSPD